MGSRALVLDRSFTKSPAHRLGPRRAAVFLLSGVLALALVASNMFAATVTAQVRLSNGARHLKNPTDNSGTAVWLTPLDPASSTEVALRAVPRRFRLIQHQKRFDPHILIVPVGSTVDFPNLDPFFHNVFSLFDGKRFDLGLYEAGSTHSVKFDRVGVSYIFCNIHPEMSAAVVVVKTPYYAVSNRAGEITIPNVAAGRYELQVFQERCLPQTLKAQSRLITVGETSVALGAIRLAESRDLLAPHKNLYGRDYDTPTPANSLYDQPQ